MTPAQIMQLSQPGATNGSPDAMYANLIQQAAQGGNTPAPAAASQAPAASAPTAASQIPVPSAPADPTPANVAADTAAKDAPAAASTPAQGALPAGSITALSGALFDKNGQSIFGHQSVNEWLDEFNKANPDAHASLQDVTGSDGQYLGTKVNYDQSGLATGWQKALTGPTGGVELSGNASNNYGLNSDDFQILDPNAINSDPIWGTSTSQSNIYQKPNVMDYVGPAVMALVTMGAASGMIPVMAGADAAASAGIASAATAGATEGAGATLGAGDFAGIGGLGVNSSINAANHVAQSIGSDNPLSTLASLAPSVLAMLNVPGGQYAGLIAQLAQGGKLTPAQMAALAASAGRSAIGGH